MLKGIFAPNDESECQVYNKKQTSPRSIAIEQLYVESSYSETLTRFKEDHSTYNQQILALKKQHSTESIGLDRYASDELWKTNFLPKVKAIEDSLSLLEEAQKKLEKEKLKVHL